MGYNVSCAPLKQVLPQAKAQYIMARLLEFIANHLFLFSLFVSIAALLFWNIIAGTLGGSQLIAAEVTRLINHEDGKILDIRSTEDFQQGHIINAINIDAKTLVERDKDLKKLKDKTVIVCCGRGQDSIRVARSLKTKGFEKLYSLKGGISAWQNADLPLTKGKV